MVGRMYLLNVVIYIDVRFFCDLLNKNMGIFFMACKIFAQIIATSHRPHPNW